MGLRKSTPETTPDMTCKTKCRILRGETDIYNVSKAKLKVNANETFQRYKLYSQISPLHQKRVSNRLIEK